MLTGEIPVDGLRCVTAGSRLWAPERRRCSRMLRPALDATDCLVTPGLINTHHHLFQNLTRAYPR